MYSYQPVFLAISIVLMLLYTSCSEDIEPTNVEIEPLDDIYYPPNNTQWESLDPLELDWNQNAIAQLKNWMSPSETRALIILHKGKIVHEDYSGLDHQGQPFNQTSQWQWASAGKTLTSSMIGIVAEEGLLTLDDKTTDFLGLGWTDMLQEREDKIKISHQLTMTTGLDDLNVDRSCVAPQCLTYLVEPGNRWAYHNGPYTLLQSVVEEATGIKASDYSKQKIETPIGMDGLWVNINNDIVFFSSARDMARYGWMIANQGRWKDEQIVPSDFIKEATTPSQTLNKSYGYLWWLNGQPSFMLPIIEREFNGSLLPDAPDDSYLAIGKSGQVLMIVPSLELVIVRMGSSNGNDFVPIAFVREMWPSLIHI